MALDPLGRKINVLDRIAKNAVLVGIVYAFIARIFLPFFIKLPDDPQSEAMVQSLMGTVGLIVGFYLGRNSIKSEEKKPEIE